MINFVFMQFLNQRKKVKANAISQDLVREICRAYLIAVDQTKNIAQKFAAPTPEESAKKIWLFLRNEITYEKDKANSQQLFLPSSFLHLKKGDCKSFAICTAAILTNLKIKNKFVLTSYSNAERPSHIYNCFRNSNFQRVPLDGCYSRFGVEKKPLYFREINLVK
jgi:hypothetical protein